MARDARPSFTERKLPNPGIDHMTGLLAQTAIMGTAHSFAIYGDDLADGQLIDQ
jgi:hypothetical protein